MFGINKDLKIHFIGIGGIGMSGIAEILLNLGYSISGSDINSNINTEKLKNLGAEIFKGHDCKNIHDVQIVVYSSAINEHNPEVVISREQKIPIIKRAEMLAELMRLKYGIAVAGSHGKTTTSSFLATIFHKLEQNPTSIIGGIVKNLGGHAIKGESDYLIAEADESDGSFLYLNPIMSIITNIDNDHLDYYKSQENIESAFLEFANKVPFYGFVAINAQDIRSRMLLSKLKRPYLTFGIRETENLNTDIDYVASEIVNGKDTTSFKVTVGDEVGDAEISLAGEHNVLNSLGAIAIAHKVLGNLSEVCKAVSEFQGVGRRFEKLLEYKKMVIIDDYAHHPTEIKATINTARDRYPNKKIITIFEPHRYSRTKEHWNDFIKCFANVDKSYISKIYPASEEPIDYIDSEVLVKSIDSEYSNATYLSSWDDLESIFDLYKNNNAVILSLGAGSISKVTREQVEKWNLKNL